LFVYYTPVEAGDVLRNRKRYNSIKKQNK